MPAYREDNGTWTSKFKYRDWRGEKRQKTKRGFERKKDALDFEAEFKATLVHSADIPFTALVKNYLGDLTKNHKIEITTAERKQRAFDKMISPYFGQKPINQIAELDVLNWQTWVQQKGFDKFKGVGYAPTYLKSINNELSAMMNYAVRYYRLPYNPCERAGSMGKSSAEAMEIWTLDQFEQFIGYADKSDAKIAFDILFWTGIREGELLALTPADFLPGPRLDIKKSFAVVNGEHIIKKPKNDPSIRCIAIPQFLYDEVQNYMHGLYGLEQTDRLFTFTKSFLLKEIKRMAHMAGLEPIRIHDLRHPYVKHTTKIFSLRSMAFQAQAYPDARRKTRGACQLHRGGQSRSPVRPLCNRKRFSCLPPQSKISWILYAISMRLSGYTSTRSISSSASSVVSASASKIALDASLRLSCRACSSCFCFACANTAA